MERVGIEMNIQVISRYRAQLRQSAQRWITKLAKSNRGDYIAEYRERIEEIYKLQKRLWEIANDERTGPHNQIEAIGKLLDCTKQLVGLYDCLPLVNAIRAYDEGKEYSPMNDERPKGSRV
jgi:hypothetical protein